MKKQLTIAFIAVLTLGLAFYLFTISPDQPSGGQGNDINLSNIETLGEPRPVVEGDLVKGNPEAKNTFIVYEDFQCPACAYAHINVTSKITDELPDTKLVFRHFPLTTIHRNALTASYAGEAAAAQGKFWEMNNLFYERQNEWANLTDPVPKFLDFAREVGMPDIEQFRADTESKKYKDRVERDMREAIGLGVNATPTFYFNGHKLENASLEGIKQQVQQYYVQ